MDRAIWHERWKGSCGKALVIRLETDFATPKMLRNLRNVQPWNSTVQCNFHALTAHSIYVYCVVYTTRLIIARTTKRRAPPNIISRHIRNIMYLYFGTRFAAQFCGSTRPQRIRRSELHGTDYESTSSTKTTTRVCCRRCRVNVPR